MKKNIIALVMSALMMINIIGCSKPETYKQETDKIEASKLEASKSGTEKPEEAISGLNTDKKQQASYEEKYRETLGTIYDFIKNVDYDAEYDDAYMGIFEAVLALDDNALNQIGYVIEDINKDNVPELLIGSFDKHGEAFTNNDIYSVYTIINDKVEYVLGGRSRSMYSLKDNGKLFYMGSNGAAYSIFGIYHLSEEGKVVCDDYYFTYPDDNDYEKIEVYHNQTGTFDKAKSEKLDITLDEFRKIQEEMATATAEIKSTSLANLGA